MRLLADLRRMMAPPVFLDEEKNHQAAVLNSLIWNLVVGTLICSGIGLPFIFSARLESLVFVGVVLAVLFAARLLLFKGKVRLAGGLLSGSLWLIFSALGILTGGIYSVNLVFLLCVSVIVGLLFGLKPAVITALVSSALVFSLALMEELGYPPPKPFPAPPFSRWIQLSLGILMTLMPLAISLRNRAQALAKAKRELASRIEAEKTLRGRDEELRQAQKMESIGKLAGGIAHDFNNILTSIMGNLELALFEDPNATIRENIQGAKEASLRAAQLTKQLLAFSRKQILELVVMDFGELVLSLRPLLARLLGEDVRINIDAKPGLFYVKADRNQVESALINLAVNARDAMPSGGSLSISLDAQEFGPERRQGMRPGIYTRLTVRDTGIGIPTEQLPHIFEPFYTTKAIGKGTGLGLAMVFGAASQNGGFVEVESELGRGTSFYLYLPRVGAETQEAQRLEISTELDRGRGSILLVEDDATVQEVAQRTLSRAGYQVRSLGSGEEAISAIVQGQGPDLLITDIILPGMDGHALAQSYRSAFPQQKVLYISGYPNETIAKHGIIKEGLHFLPKPFSPQELAAKVRQAIEAE